MKPGIMNSEAKTVSSVCGRQWLMTSPVRHEEGRLWLALAGWARLRITRSRQSVICRATCASLSLRAASLSDPRPRTRASRKRHLT